LRKGERKDGRMDGRAKRKHARRASYRRYTLLCTGKNYLHAARKLLITKDSQKRHPECIPLSSYRARTAISPKDSLAKVAPAFATQHPNAKSNHLLAAYFISLNFCTQHIVYKNIFCFRGWR